MNLHPMMRREFRAVDGARRRAVFEALLAWFTVANTAALGWAANGEGAWPLVWAGLLVTAAVRALVLVRELDR